MKVIVTFALTILFFMSPIQINGYGSAANTRQAQQLLSQARAALGGEAKFKAIRSLEISGEMQRIIADRQQGGTITLAFLLPDKFKKSETMNLMAGVEITLVNAMYGNEVWSNSSTSSSGPRVRVTNTDEGAEGIAEQRRYLRAEMARYLFALLLTSTPSFPVEFSYVGEAQASDGRADVIEAKGGDGFSARLFLDKNTHRPLMMSYLAPDQNVSITTDRQSRGRDSNRKGKASSSANGQLVETQMYFSDYRAEGGILLPHRISRSAGGKTVEDLTFNKASINPSLKPTDFEKK